VHAELVPFSIVDEEIISVPSVPSALRLSSKQSRRKSWKMPESRRASLKRRRSSRGSQRLSINQTDEFRPFVIKLLRRCVRRTCLPTPTDPSEPPSPLPDSGFSHLAEMIIRTALREDWDLRDAKTAAENIRDLMFRPDSWLLDVARYIDAV